MSWVIAMRATKAKAPKSTGFVDDLGVGNRLTRGWGVSLRPDLSRHQQDRLRWRDPPLHRVDKATSDDWEPDDGSFRALIVVLALPLTQGASKSCQNQKLGKNSDDMPRSCYVRFKAPDWRPCWISVWLASLQGGIDPGGALPTANDPSPPVWGSESQTLEELRALESTTRPSAIAPSLRRVAPQPTGACSSSSSGSTSSSVSSSGSSSSPSLLSGSSSQSPSSSMSSSSSWSPSVPSVSFRSSTRRSAAGALFPRPCGSALIVLCARRCASSRSWARRASRSAAARAVAAWASSWALG